jgi:pSer/pThr/pTyr-binding forkhead associated (FHA) protein
LAGVSRWHCSLRNEAQATWLIDHSRHGTWLNDERVAGRAEVFAGDRIRLGDPGIELTLLAIETGDGASAR